MVCGVAKLFDLIYVTDLHAVVEEDPQVQPLLLEIEQHATDHKITS